MGISSVRHVSAFGVVARIARLENGVEVIPSPEAEMLLGVDRRTVSEHLGNLSSHTGQNSPALVPVAELRQHGLAPQGRGRPPRLITKEEFQFLVKKVNTPQAWAIYNELWGAAEMFVRAEDTGMPDWARSMQGELTARFDALEHAHNRTIRRVEHLEENVNIYLTDGQAKRVQREVALTKDALGVDGRQLTGYLRKYANTNGLYRTDHPERLVAACRALREGKTQLPSR